MENRADVVSHLLGYCLQSRENAEELFETVVSRRSRTVQLFGETVELTEEERGEFVERFSAEIEPTLWESKRLKH
jgi:hypothetical protein